MTPSQIEARILGACASGPKLHMDLLIATDPLVTHTEREVIISLVNRGLLARQQTDDGFVYSIASQATRTPWRSIAPTGRQSRGVDIDAVHRNPRWQQR